MKIMSYKGYSAHVELDAHDRLFVCHLAGMRDIVGFHGASVDELEAAFREAVDDYLAACKKLGVMPPSFGGTVSRSVGSPPLRSTP
ncbi:MAG TPA: hypothetical protein VFQ16_03485 [Burkholderiaceae bacterium]|nr:hypothetical protein [Burkholderiaceae bacterium]